MKNKIILNIPHSSLLLPKEFINKEKNLTYDGIKKFNYNITDLFTDKLFSSKLHTHIKAKYSRIACDVEKFVDDDKEVMSKYGLGVIYKNDLNQNSIFKELDEKYKEMIIKKYYIPYHAKLNKVVKHIKGRKVILVDCHSFSKDIIVDEAKKTDLPDVCIGYNSYCFSQQLVDYTCKYFKNLGYSVGINYPYQGAIVPNCLFNSTTNNFYSIMIEINKRLYLDKNKRNKNFKNLKKAIKKYLSNLKILKITI